jgi:hypothetical protein
MTQVMTDGITKSRTIHESGENQRTLDETVRSEARACD